MPFKIIGSGKFVQSVPTPNGSAAVPSLSFQGAPTSGLYHAGNGNVGISINGTETLKVSADGVSVVNGYIRGNGSLLEGVSTTLANLNASNISSGLLAVAYGGTGVSSSVGTGNVVLSDNPTVYGNVVVDGNVSAANYTGNIAIGNLDIVFDSGGYFEANIGNVLQPGYSFDMDTSTGLYRPSPSTIGFVSGGVEAAQISSSGVAIANGSAATPSLSFTSQPSSGLFVSGGNLGVTVGGVEKAHVSSNGVTVNGSISVSNGSAATPSLSFTSQPSSGLFVSGTNVGVTVGGVEKAHVSSNGVTVNGSVSVSNGSAATPSLSFTSQPSSGLFVSGGNVGVTVGGVEKAHVSSHGFTVNGNIIGDVNAMQLTGTLDNARLPASINISGNATAAYFLGNGAYLSGLSSGTNASSINTGVLSVSYGGTGTTSSSGTGNVVLSNSPLLHGNVVVDGNVSVRAGTLSTPSYTFSANTGVGLYLSNNVVTSSTNLQTPAGVAMAMNTNVTAGGHSVYIHPMACAWYNASAPGVVTSNANGDYRYGTGYTSWGSYGQYNLARVYVNLPAGSYKFVYTYVSRDVGGIITIKLNDVTITTVDTYYNSVSPIYQTNYQYNIPITTSGVHKLEFQANAQNASVAGGWWWNEFIAAALIRTG